VSDPLPERPDLGQLRRQAKELRDAARAGDAAAVERMARHYPATLPGPVRLAAAQLVIARELGLPSWPALIAALDADAVSRRAVAAFLAASIDGRMRQSGDTLRADPGIAERSLSAAAVLGDAAAVGEHLAAEPAAASAVDAERGWPPLLYACYSRWPQVDPGRAAGLAEAVRLLLAAGADPNTNDGGRRHYHSALKGSVEVNNPDVTEALLEAGAQPDPGQPVAEATAHRDLECLRLLLSHGARVASTWALGAAVFNDNAGAAALLLDAVGRGAADAASRELPEAAATASPALVEVLLAAGADPQAADSDGVSALRLAVRAGWRETAARLAAHGAVDDSTQVDRFLGGCLNADQGAVRQLLTDHPDLPDRLTDDDWAVIADAAATRSAEALALMLESGFAPGTRRHGEPPLHAAAYRGNAAGVRILLAAGAEVDARDDQFQSTALAFATVGSGEQAGKPGDWTGTVRALIEAGASRDGVWVTGKPPSEEVADQLLQYGISPREPKPEPDPEPHDRDDDDDANVPVQSLGTGVMADIARHLETAAGDLDLDLLGSLLHPDVRWTGLCRDRAQVLDWYRAVLAEGIEASVRSVEVDRDAVLLGLLVTRPARGARPAPPEPLFQVFTVRDAQIVEIRGYPDRATALARG
jgi:ankyrin repeat protein